MASQMIDLAGENALGKLVQCGTRAKYQAGTSGVAQFACQSSLIACRSLLILRMAAFSP
jgi:hypothetical protein